MPLSCCMALPRKCSGERKQCGDRGRGLLRARFAAPGMMFHSRGGDDRSRPGAGIWFVSFMHYDLGYFDLEQKTLQPLDNPFGTRLSPMS